jgi:hypothetical protein
VERDKFATYLHPQKGTNLSLLLLATHLSSEGKSDIRRASINSSPFTPTTHDPTTPIRVL